MGNKSSQLKDFFNNKIFNDIKNGFSSTLGKFVNYGTTMLDNMMKMSMNISSFASTPYFLYILLFGGAVFLAIRLRLI